ncbi:MAG: SGNH/GDSL hydrolase family protein [Sphingomonadales bacterium]|nr:MAG: SGNH/GDSL hydrolase family protein [Sphingomonadales bacterium]
MRWIRSIGAIAAAFCMAAATPALAQAGWTRGWAASMWQGNAEQAVTVENVTIRSAVRIGAGGTQLRLRLSNEYGQALTVGAASVRTAGGASVRVTFGGQASFKIPAGAPLVSDPVSLPVKAFELVEISLFLPEKAVLDTLHEAAGAPTQISAPGDFTGGDFTAVTTNRVRPLVAGLDIFGAKSRPVIVAFGDSITDVGSCPNEVMPRCRWSEVLGRRLAAAGMPHVVINHGISGNRVLAPGTGPSALARIDRDVLTVPGVTHVVLLEGVNDAGSSGLTRNGTTRPVISAAELIAGYRQFVQRAHERGIKVIAMTILPFEGAFYYAPERDAIRMEANAFIRGSGVFDGVIDMEKIVMDPANPKRLATAFQGEKGDNLHPDAAGQAAMGEAIPLKLFR